MAKTVDQVMTHDPATLAAGATLVDAARLMRDEDVGAIIVSGDGGVAGIVTDRDIVVRAVVDGRDPSATHPSDVLSGQVTMLTPDQSVHDAARLMREHDVRRLPVVQDGRQVGIVAIGDLAVELDSESALADISAATPNR